MTVEQLRSLLAGLAPTLEIFVASDEEWNKLNKLYSADDTYMVDGEAVNHDDVMAGLYEGEEIKRGIVLWG